MTDAQRALVEESLWVVGSCLEKEQRTGRLRIGPGISREDLFAVGCEALCRAAQKWHPGRGTKFTTYAYWCILGYMLNHINRFESPRGMTGHYSQDFPAGGPPMMSYEDAQLFGDARQDAISRLDRVIRFGVLGTERLCGLASLVGLRGCRGHGSRREAWPW